MTVSDETTALRIACDAMCGGLARWLRLLGVDTSYTPGIDDGDLVIHARSERRLVISSDHKLFERRVFTKRQLRGLLLPVGLKLRDQVRFVGKQIKLPLGFPRCTLCNGLLNEVSRQEVADVVPAKSLVWARTFYRCNFCAHVFWEGTHWQRIAPLRQELERFAAAEATT